MTKILKEDIKVFSLQEADGKITIDLLKDGNLITYFIEGKLVNPFVEEKK